MTNHCRSHFSHALSLLNLISTVSVVLIQLLPNTSMRSGESFGRGYLRNISVDIQEEVQQQRRSLSKDNNQDKNQDLDYTWIGNHWVPPSGVPTYSSKQAKEIWSRRNVFMIGDSTSRQDWATLAAILELEYNQTNNNISSPHVSVQDLDKNLNVNKMSPDEICTLRDFQQGLYRERRFTNTSLVCRGGPGSGYNRDKKFDTMHVYCNDRLSEVLEEWELAQNKQLLSKEYDILIIENGIWEIIKGWACRPANNTLSVHQRLTNSLEAAYRTASPNLHIYWKTVGAPPDRDSNHTKKADAYNQHIRDWFAATGKKNPYLHLHDWGKQILPRAFGDQRIEGDLKPHWGLEARTLNVQMLTHELDKLATASSLEQTS